ncbi:MAG TPA: tRNA pseudouridine(55) synthase TruB, partial [Bacillales bacterium]|nr:tRNA pseudouridine(55) synthase TruB [Bacillales bacterium]
WTGPVEQVPPMYSAVKVKGKRLYEYAREGLEIERPKRQVRIYELKLLDSHETFHGEFPVFRVRVRCSKGTYIRTLAVNIGQELGYPAHMSALLRTISGNFSLADCLTLEQIEKMVEKRELEDQLFPIDKAISSLPKMTVNESVEAKVRNGAVLPLPSGMEEKTFTVYNEEGHLLAVYQEHPAKPGLMKPQKVFT